MPTDPEKLEALAVADSEVGCTNHGCVWGHPGGVGTNGRCTCIMRLTAIDAQRARHRIRQMRDALREAAAEIRTLRAEVEPLRADERRMNALENALNDGKNEARWDGNFGTYVIASETGGFDGLTLREAVDSMLNAHAYYFDAALAAEEE